MLGAHAARTPESRTRGLGRFATQFTDALLAARPGLVAAVDEGGSARPSPEPLVYHVLSPLELLPLAQVWPSWARESSDALVVTLHDLIPLIFGDRYIPPSPEKLAYMTRLGLVRQADMVLAVSEATGQDAIDWLGLEPERVCVVYEDCSPLFKPSGLPPKALINRLRAAVPELRPDYCLYVAGRDWRKNLAGAIRGYARVDPALRARHPFVIVCGLQRQARSELESEAARLGVAGDVLLTDELPDEALAGLYEACRLFVFPSLYEGFGLPLLEAMRCGAVAVCADNSSLPELVTEPAARFDANDHDAFAQVVSRGLVDTGFRGRLGEVSRDTSARFSWRRTVELSAAAYEEAALIRNGGVRTGRRGRQTAGGPAGAASAKPS